MQYIRVNLRNLYCTKSSFFIASKVSVISCNRMLSSRCFTIKEVRKPLQNKIQSRHLQMETMNELRSNKLPFDNLSNLTQDVLLFSYEKSKIMKYLTYFGIAQLAVWVYLGINLYSSLRDIKTTTKTEEYQSKHPFWRRINLGEQSYRIAALASCLMVGIGTAFITFTLPTRIIRYLILCKGGAKTRIITYGPFGRTRELNVPLNHLSCQTSRTSKASYISLKIKGRWMYFLLDTRGTFKHPQLFDFTVGATKAKLH